MEALALTEAGDVGLSFSPFLVSLRPLSTEGIAGGVCEVGSSRVLNVPPTPVLHPYAISHGCDTGFFQQSISAPGKAGGRPVLDMNQQSPTLLDFGV